MSCPTLDIYESLEHCLGETVLPGLRQRAWGIPKKQILKWPKLPNPSDEGATMETIASYEGDFSLAADAAFFTIDILDTASNIKSESQGTLPSKTFVNTLTLKYAGNNAAATGFCRLANSDDLVYIIQQRDGAFRVLGNEMFRSDTKPSQESGMEVTDSSGTQFEITVTDVCPAPFYSGKFKTADGTMDCATGDVEASE